MDNRSLTIVCYHMQIVVVSVSIHNIFQGLPNQDWKEKDFGARFNFSRVAGSNVLDRQIRKIQSKVLSVFIV